jgi:hypothetical protein
MLSAQEGWAAGNRFVHYNGLEWQVSPPISGTVNAIDMVSSSDGWAVGTEGRIWHYTGGVWQTVPSPTDYWLYDIDMVDANDGWAVGAKSGGSFLNPDPPTGIILHYDGTAWNVVARTPSYPLYAVSMANRYTGRIVGEWGTMLRLDLSGTGTVNGAVRDEAGKPLAGIAVYGYRNTGTWSEAGAAVTNEQGAYQLTLPIGEYRFHFRSPTAAYRSEYYNDRANFADADSLTVGDGAQVRNIDAVMAAPPPPAINVSGPAATSVDPVTGQVTAMVSRTGTSQVTFQRTVTCSGGTAPTNVVLDVGGKTFAMTPRGSVFSTTLTIPGDLPNSIGPFNLIVRYQCGASQQAPPVGTLMLYDPSGVIADANGKPLAGSIVSLHRVPDAQPDQGDQRRDCRTIDTRPGGLGGDWSGVPAADPNAGVFVNPRIDSEALLISPDTNPQVTGTNGRFGWDVATGCWYVTVVAKGYETVISPLVGVPPAVTDLDLELKLSEQKIYLPTLRK